MTFPEQLPFKTRTEMCTEPGKSRISVSEAIRILHPWRKYPVSGGPALYQIYHNLQVVVNAGFYIYCSKEST